MQPDNRTSYPITPDKMQITSNLQPTDRQREFARLMVKGLRQFAAGLGTLISAVVFYYGLPVGGGED